MTRVRRQTMRGDETGDLTLRKNHALQLFKTEMCKFWLKGRCVMDDCSYAHGVEQLQKKPDLTATSLCKEITISGICTDPQCRFAHSEEELRATHGFFKMKMCGFVKSGRCKNGSQCRFAHDPSELRLAKPSALDTQKELSSDRRQSKERAPDQVWSEASIEQGVPPVPAPFPGNIGIRHAPDAVASGIRSAREPKAGRPEKQNLLQPTQPGMYVQDPIWRVEGDPLPGEQQQQQVALPRQQRQQKQQQQPKQQQKQPVKTKSQQDSQEVPAQVVRPPQSSHDVGVGSGGRQRELMSGGRRQARPAARNSPDSPGGHASADMLDTNSWSQSSSGNSSATEFPGSDESGRSRSQEGKHGSGSGSGSSGCGKVGVADLTGGSADVAADKAQAEASKTKTTLLIMNIPCYLTQGALLSMLEDLTSSIRGAYDFFYCPWDEKAHHNLGYAMINFKDPADANAFQQRWSNKELCRGIRGQKTLRVVKAALQGLEANVDYFTKFDIACSELRFRPLVRNNETGRLQPLPLVSEDSAVQAPMEALTRAYCWQHAAPLQQHSQLELQQLQQPQQLPNDSQNSLRQTSSGSDSGGNDVCQAQLKPWPGSTVDAGPQNKNFRRLGAAAMSWAPEQQQQTFMQMSGPGGNMQVFPEGTTAVSSMGGTDQLPSGLGAAAGSSGDNGHQTFQQLVPCMVLDPSMGLQQGNFMGFQMIQAPANNLAPAHMTPVATANLAGLVALGNLPPEVYFR